MWILSFISFSFDQQDVHMHILWCHSYAFSNVTSYSSRKYYIQFCTSCDCSRPSWIMERSVNPQPSPMTWQLSSSSSAGSFRSLCFPLSSMQLCSKPRRCPTRRTGLQPSSCCPVCCLQETPPVCIICSTSSPESPRGLIWVWGHWTLVDKVFREQYCRPHLFHSLQFAVRRYQCNAVNDHQCERS